MTVRHSFYSNSIISNKMAMTMAQFWVFLVLSVIGTKVNGEFSVYHSPDSLKFSGSQTIKESLLKEVFTASLGLSVDENSEWNGLYVSDPFNTPEAVVEVYIDAATESLGDSAVSKSKKFPLIIDNYEHDTFVSVEHRIKQRNGGMVTAGKPLNKIVIINLSNPNEFQSEHFKAVFGTVPEAKVRKMTLAHLNPSVEEDYQFLKELETLRAITAAVDSYIRADNVIDLFYLHSSSLHTLSDYHGLNSLQIKEAKKLLAEAIQELSDAFVRAYNGSVLVTSVVSNVKHLRRIQRAAEDTALPTAVDAEMNDDNYNADYPAIFNIMLWFGVVFTFTLIAIVYAIMDMDPGRDSIIYRMTSTRMKKDN